VDHECLAGGELSLETAMNLGNVDPAVPQNTPCCAICITRLSIAATRRLFCFEKPADDENPGHSTTRADVEPGSSALSRASRPWLEGFENGQSRNCARSARARDERKQR